MRTLSAFAESGFNLFSGGAGQVMELHQQPPCSDNIWPDGRILGWVVTGLY